MRIVGGEAMSTDAARKRLGKKPIPRKSFGFVPNLEFRCTVFIPWELLHVLYTMRTWTIPTF